VAVNKKLVTAVSEEFVTAELGDVRLSRRLRMMTEAAEQRPGATLPSRAGSIAALEGTYRFLANPKVTAEVLFGAHAVATVERAASEDDVLVIHDTTEFRFGGAEPRDGMGWLNSDNIQGFLAHFSIAATREGRPLGTVGLQAWVRQGPKIGARKKRVARLRNPDRESQRWLDAALQAAERLNDKARFIHVMDREGDQFELLCALVEHDQRFVVRLGHDRRLHAGRGRSAKPKLFESLGSCPFFFRREVAIATRGKPVGSNKNDVFPPRKSRTAQLEVRAGTRQIFASHMAAPHLPASLSLQVVEVREVNAPAGEVPVVWRLVTTEPVDTEAQVAAVVDAYRQRWLIEEFFKVVKTGCKYQRLQLESLRALLIALAIETAVAWRLLLLRWAAQNSPTLEAEAVLSQEHVELLCMLRVSRTSDPCAALNARDALFELAQVGGHIPNNGPPGWLVLQRGIDALLLIQRGRALGRPEVRGRSDQS
jgi:hypothetical protein